MAASEQFKVASFDITLFFQLVFFYYIAGNVHVEILKPAMLEHILHRISIT